MKNIFQIALILIVVILIMFIGWIVFRKAGEGEDCEYAGACMSGLNCVNSKCSSGKSGSYCSKVEDCKTIFCTSNLCSDGKTGEPCNTYEDCEKDHLCEKSVCKPEPTWPKYFKKIELQKMIANTPPGPDNVPFNATNFSKIDGMNLNIQTKAGVEGEMYFEVVNPISGIVIFTYPKFTASGLLGRGFPAPQFAGSYQIKVYFKSELVDEIDFTVK